MVSIQQYKEYWNTIRMQLPQIKSLEFILTDKDMGTAIQNLKKENQPILFVTIPSSDGGGHIDNDKEKNIALLFLLSKYDSQSENKAIGIVEHLQPIFEEIKDRMKEDSGNSCSIMANLEFDSMHSDPEYKLYSDLSGWSLSFVF